MSRPTKKEVLDAIKVLNSAIENEMLYDSRGTRIYSFYAVRDCVVPDADTLAKISYLDADLSELREAVSKIEDRKVKVMAGKTLLETLGFGDDNE